MDFVKFVENIVANTGLFIAYFTNSSYLFYLFVF